MTFTVAIVGRPNVGKSTLFNRLVGKRLAIVDDRPGVTRDRREAEGQLAGMTFRLVDTAGLEEAFDDSLEARMRRQTERALEQADVVLLLIDARAGVTPLDAHFARWLRRGRAPVLLVANKCEGRGGEAGLLDAYSLGLGDPIPISAAHGEGLGMLAEALLPFEKPESAADAAADALDLPDAGSGAWERAIPQEPPAEDADAPEEEDKRPLQLAIVGRPNVGKSTLVNALLGEERMLTGPEPGITRDAIAVPWEWRGRALKLIDTAGMRRRARVEEGLEKLSVTDTLRAVRYAHVVVLVLDAAEILDKQDLAIARHVEEEGRAIVIAVNKWDTVTEPNAVLERLRDRLGDSLPQVKGVATVMISAATKHNLPKLMDAVLAAYAVWTKRVRTGDLNRWLGEVTARHPPPAVAGRRLRFRYMTQVKARPPRFALWTSRPDAVPDSYLRYLVNSLREVFDLPGTPIRIALRRTDNPYDP